MNRVKFRLNDPAIHNFNFKCIQNKINSPFLLSMANYAGHDHIYLVSRRVGTSCIVHVAQSQQTTVIQCITYVRGPYSSLMIVFPVWNCSLITERLSASWTDDYSIVTIHFHSNNNLLSVLSPICVANSCSMR